MEPIFIFNPVENKGEMTFKSNVCKAWFVPYSEVQIGFWTFGRMLVVWWVVLPIRYRKLFIISVEECIYFL